MTAFIVLMAETAGENPGLFNYGAMGILLAWFMFRYEKRSDSADKRTDVMIDELRGVRHGQVGLQQAMLVVEINRDNCNPAARSLADKMLEEIQVREVARKEQRKSRDRSE